MKIRVLPPYPREAVRADAVPVGTACTYNDPNLTGLVFVRLDELGADRVPMLVVASSHMPSLGKTIWLHRDESMLIPEKLAVTQ